jgi:pyruvate formate-lyase activating enzyme-like uncharacterized protein
MNERFNGIRHTVDHTPMEKRLATGCIHCHEGAKMVLFITGICPRSCWYCPLSSQRKGHDVVYANEKSVYSPGESLAVARKMRASGTGITGGEPLVRLERVISYAGRLKEEFGKEHHIHLYTGRAPDESELRRLAGFIDEIRMHPPVEYWTGISLSNYRDSAVMARDMGYECGFEVPALPEVGNLLPALEFLDFLNINELEWGETNAPEMRRRRLMPEDSVHNAVNGSRGWAVDISRHPNVHFCSSEYKDLVQLRKRLIRTAMNTARPFDEITDDGTIVYGRIEFSGEVPAMIKALGREMYEVRDGGIETASWVLMEHGAAMGNAQSIIERYPDRGIVVEVIPL